MNWAKAWKDAAYEWRHEARRLRLIERWYKRNQRHEVRLALELQQTRDALKAIIADQEARYQPFDEAAQLARVGLGLPRLEPPPPDVAMTELRARFGHHFDGLDAEAFVREVRGDESTD